MYKNFILSILLAAIIGLPNALNAQFAPEAGQPGTTAIHADSSIFVAWATGCVTQRGPIKMGMDSLASMGHDSLVPGVPGGIYDIICLGDGGISTVTFASPIYNGPGPDFAVFENGFHNTPHVFLELAFVEVSSDGENFFRFPAVTNVPETPQVGPFATTDATLIHNFAGKYEAFYGTPFDLDEVEDNLLLDKNNITHVRVIDVVGSINPDYCTYDSQGHVVNDPWPTPFNSSGFDLDAVGVIHDLEHYEDAVAENSSLAVSVYPNPTNGKLVVDTDQEVDFELLNAMGQTILKTRLSESATFDLTEYGQGVYFVVLTNQGKKEVKKVVKL